MYIREELDQEYCDFLRREVVPILRRTPVCGDYINVKEKRELLELLGIERILVVTNGAGRMEPVGDCSDYHVNIAIATIDLEVRDYRARFFRWKREQKIKPTSEQLTLEFSGVYRCGERDMSGRMSRETGIRRIIGARKSNS